MAFCTVITCMDGRIQRPMMDYLRSNFNYDCPDTITDPGPVKALADITDTAYFDRVRERIDISVFKHGSRHIFVTGHDHCAGNPASKDIQIAELLITKQRIVANYSNCQVDMIYLNLRDEQWQCEAVD